MSTHSVLTSLEPLTSLLEPRSTYEEKTNARHRDLKLCAVPISTLGSVAPETKLSTIKPEAMSGGILIVKSRSNKVLGILTDGDFRRGNSVPEGSERIVRDVMTREPKSIAEVASIADAFNLMIFEDINHLLLTDSNEKYSGLVSLHQLAKRLSPEQLFIDLQNQAHSENERRHIARYRFAASFFKGENTILDGACGCGYGSKILSSTGAKVLAVDLNDSAIKFGENALAKRGDSGGSIDFQVADLNELYLADNSLDGVVSLETLEHIDLRACRSYLSKASKWIKPGGILVASSPMLRFKNGKPFITNPYHINEQKKSDLLQMFNQLLPNFKLHFFHQKDDVFLPLDSEDTGFCVVLGRKCQ